MFSQLDAMTLGSFFVVLALVALSGVGVWEGVSSARW
jgi:hypothetical protein